MRYTHRNRSLVLMLAASFVVLGGCKKGSTQSTFRDDLSGFSITKPDGWYIETGDELREQARREAARAGDPKLAGPPQGASHEVLARITKYAPGHAQGPNPTVVFTRFDLQRFPPGTNAETLLRMGIATAHLEEGPAKVELAGRSWQKAAVTRLLRDPAGQEHEVAQGVYVAVGKRWAIGVTVGTVREEYNQYQPTFDAILQSMKFDD